MHNQNDISTKSVSQLAQFWENMQDKTSAPSSSAPPKLLTPSHLEKALTEWIKDAAPTENRLLAKQKILDAYDTQADTLALNDLALQSLPECLGTLTQLSTLKAENNALEALPKSICNLKALRHLDLYDNQLSSLPEGFEQLEQLDTLDLRQNKFTARPKKDQLPSPLNTLKLEDNPIEEPHEAEQEAPCERTLSGPSSLDSTCSTPTNPSTPRVDNLATLLTFETMGLLDPLNDPAPVTPKTAQPTRTVSMHNPMTFQEAVTASLLYLHATSPNAVRLKGATFEVQQKSTNPLRKLHVLGPKWIDLKQALIKLHGNRPEEAPYFAHNELLALVQRLPKKHRIHAQIVNNDTNQVKLEHAMRDTINPQPLANP